MGAKPMLKEIRLKNFKIFDSHGATVRPARVTIFIGPNGTGKSSVLQALGMLKQSRGQREFIPNLPRVKVGGFEDVVHDGAREVTFGLTFDVREPIRPISDSQEWEVDYTLVGDREGKLRSHTVKYVLSNQTIEVGTSGSAKRREIAYPTRPTVTVTENPRIALPIYVNVQGDDNELYEAWRTLRLATSQFLTKVYVVPLYRALTEPEYALSAATIDMTRPEEVANVLAYNPEIQELVSGWSEDIVDCGVDFRLLPDNRIATEIVLGTRKRINIANEGAGTQHLIWPLAQVAAAPSGSLIAVEEPEIHLHPRAQTRLARVLANAVAEGEKQVLLTTQSEHMLVGFLTRVAEGTLAPAELSVYYFERKGNAGQATHLPVNEKGQLSGGLRGFVEASLEQLEEYLGALG